RQLHKERWAQRALQEVLVREALEINSIAAAHHSLVVTEGVPGETRARPEISVGAAGARAARANSGSAGQAGEIDVGGDTEPVGVGDQRRIKEGGGLEQGIGKLQ